jgi:two-component system CheB/CheR fusion protein
VTTDDDDPLPKPTEPTEPTEPLEDLLHFIKDSRGFDFTGYKRSTLIRRIRKRMSDIGVHEYIDYRDRLEADSGEFLHLFNTILINVTSFFRDPEAWSYLQREVLPELVGDLDEEEEIRVWSAGCSTGEEAYSLAIMFSEILGIDACVKRVKIYGTDVDEDALRVARAAVYPEKALDAMDTELRAKYFSQYGAGFVFRSDLRRQVIFGRHDITRDAPISRLNLLACRNTLMYFNIEAQSQILDRFYFALRPGGFLFLGKAEMLLSNGQRFDVDNMRQRIFRCRAAEVRPLYHPAIRLEATADLAEVRDGGRRRQLRDLAFDVWPRAVVIIDADGNTVLANREARTLFALAPQDVGKPFRDLEMSYRPLELRSRIERVYHMRQPEEITAVQWQKPGKDIEYLDVLIQPLISPEGAAVGATLTFTDSTKFTNLQLEAQRDREALDTAHEELQSTNEELETTNEELQSSIEELETTNEELQSTNEELETTNEELSSGNEELETMNEELRTRTTELDETRHFLEGVLASITAGVVVLDGDERIHAWNKGSEELWGLRADEVIGHLWSELDIGLPTERLQDLITRSAEPGAAPVRVDAINRRGKSIVCSVTGAPMAGLRGGVVLMMEDVTGQ